MERRSSFSIPPTRLDQFLLDQGFATDLREARALILRGRVVVDGRLVNKAGFRICSGLSVLVRPFEKDNVSRGTDKIQPVLEKWNVPVAGGTWADVGAGTGGFTEALLSLGAKRVYALDVGRGVLHCRLREDPRVVSMEGLNVRHLRESPLPEACDGVTVDVSFISLLTVIKGILVLLKDEAVLLPLIKPQFEAERRHVEPGGVITRVELIQGVLIRVLTGLIQEHGLHLIRLAPAALCGRKGNQEFIAWLSRGEVNPGLRPDHAVMNAMKGAT